jgi:glycine/D-amino acid oxidase-like deaminating enzyme
LLLHEPVDINFSIGAGFFCLIPRSDALIIGALFQEAYETEAPTKVNEELLWNNVSKICETPGSIVSLPSGILSRDKIKGSVSGIRPYRTKGVRIEIEKMFDKCIIHDYGHGGAGITLSWGCAKHAVALLKTASL